MFQLHYAKTGTVNKTTTPSGPLLSQMLTTIVRIITRELGQKSICVVPATMTFHRERSTHYLAVCILCHFVALVCFFNLNFCMTTETCPCVFMYSYVLRARVECRRYFESRAYLRIRRYSKNWRHNKNIFGHSFSNT